MSKKKKSTRTHNNATKFTSIKPKMNGSVLSVRNSRSRTNKHAKRGLKGKDCLFYNHNKFTCTNKTSGYYNCFCNLDKCHSFVHRTDIDTNNLSNYDENYIELPSQMGVHETTNEYISISKNIGTPCHINYLKSDGIRRHKARCIFYDKIRKICTYFATTCAGSSHCDKYKENR